MTDFFFVFIYVGGATAYPSVKRGILHRVFWPIDLGTEIYAWVRERQ